MEYLNFKLTSLWIATHVLILLAKGKVRNKNMGFFNSYNWQMLCEVMMSFFTKHFFKKKSISINHGIYKLLVILCEHDKLNH
jgi:hypothetical protein